VPWKATNLDFNKLKVPILELLVEDGAMDGASVSRRLAESNQIVIDIHALRMALMRYYKQGLLRRERSGGVFRYTISQRGVQRLRWLQQHGEGRGD
jgi:DNA-binding PadR family transcriptional regulator